jgi:hypothetical protein
LRATATESGVASVLIVLVRRGGLVVVLYTSTWLDAVFTT